MLLTFPVFASAQLTNEYLAEYKASANGISASARRGIEKLDENNFRLRMNLESNLGGKTIAGLEQITEFEVRDGELIPKFFSELESGLISDTALVSFNWESRQVYSSENEENWTLPLSGGELDPLSYQLALRDWARKGGEDDIELKIVDGDEIESQLFRITAREILETELGKLNTVKLERIREEAAPRTTSIWFATDWDYLLVAIKQKNSSGMNIELELEQAEVNGVAVTALP